MNTTLELPLPHLAKGRFASITAYTDEALFETDGVRIAFTEREGGVSTGAFDSLNFGEHVDDDLACVRENRARICHALGVDLASCVVPRQVHGSHIVTIESSVPAALEAVRLSARQGADGLLVEGCDVSALLCFADCIPVIIVSPTGRFAVVHAGWRGVENEIAASAVQNLVVRDKADGFGGGASCLNCYIGPHIHGCCFETDERVHRLFTEAFGSACAIDGCHIDLGLALRVSLGRVGIDAGRIADVAACTVCRNDRFFSYRAQGGVCGRHGAFAVRKKVR